MAESELNQPIDDEIEGEADEVSSKISDDFAFKLVNAVKSMNQGEISYYELVNSFSFADELKCLYLFVKALPYDPIIPIYPETPFLFFSSSCNNPVCFRTFVTSCQSTILQRKIGKNCDPYRDWAGSGNLLT